jgi:tetratricopeptide (TPR) repeat protein
MPTKPALFLMITMFMASPFSFAKTIKQDENFEAGRQAYETGEYVRAAQLLRQAAAKSPQDAEIHLWLAKTYYESQQHDAAIASAERAVELNPQSSVYHEWLGKVYGEKADHAAMFSALSLARKAHKEFETAVELDEKNLSARQALIEFDCAAPGIAGGGEDKARAQIEKIAAMDPAEGHYAAGNCRRQKKDFAAAQVEFEKAIASHPSSPNLIYDIGDFAMKRNLPEMLIAVSEEGERADATDPRGTFYRGVALILKQDRLDEAERLLRSYLHRAPMRSNFPHSWRAHEYLGRLYEQQGRNPRAIEEYEIALRLEPKNHSVREALKRLKKGS